MSDYAIMVSIALLAIYAMSEGVDRLVFGVWFLRWQRNLVLTMVAQLLVQLFVLAVKLLRL